MNPFHPVRFWGHLGRAYFTAKQYAEAVEAFQHFNEPDVGQHAFLAAANAYLEEQGRAESHKAAILKREPDFSSSAHAASLHYKNDQDREHFRQALPQAGLPD
ncbi:MAG: hypothetical protein QGG19_04085 [Alphaproteobacteria bacterium]|nr:hypothetical protein [Rhodospirillaceae bacterium]MDP6020477.1 hypothetical protein [Alphaproteobacteria bacterium]MDP7052701.1 hypothetical protein [Alphaproteobacteria bacterium]MDP7229819.1 hypothetical protein [Alphaproteobacteria bacterium]MDP7460999.1 hypothetical protein [Alphaproteobacteria bacterium]